MEPRIDHKKVSPGAIKAMFGLASYVHQSGLETALLDLVNLRVSQINGCAYCIDMHAKDLRAAGEPEERIYELDAWRETPFYSERERAALAWAEAVTLVTDGHVPDGVFQQARSHFNEQELVNLTLAVVAINGWNRLNIAFRTVSGQLQARAIREFSGTGCSLKRTEGASGRQCLNGLGLLRHHTIVSGRCAKRGSVLELKIPRILRIFRGRPDLLPIGEVGGGLDQMGLSVVG